MRGRGLDSRSLSSDRRLPLDPVLKYDLIRFDHWSFERTLYKHQIFPLDTWVSSVLSNVCSQCQFVYLCLFIFFGFSGNFSNDTIRRDVVWYRSFCSRLCSEDPRFRITVGEGCLVCIMNYNRTWGRLMN